MATMVRMLVGNDKGNYVWKEREEARRLGAAGQAVVYARHPETQEWMDPAVLAEMIAPLAPEATSERIDP